MKRDKDLIKAILEVAEDAPAKHATVITPRELPDRFSDVSLGELIRHGHLMIDYGLIKGTGDRHGITITSITWNGYEFLDNARETTIWNAAVKAAGGLSWNVFVNVLTETATEYARKILHSYT
jgi:hypothetical protein